MADYNTDVLSDSFRSTTRHKEITIPREEIEKVIQHLQDGRIEEVIDYLHSYLKVEVSTQKFLFKAHILFNRGLGNQIKETPEFEAISFEEAQKMAITLANEIIGEDKWKEVKVRPVVLMDVKVE